MSTTPDAIQAFATAETASLTSLATALTNLQAGITQLDTMITNLQNSQGTLSAADQAALDSIQTTSQAVLAQAQAISSATPGTVISVVPVPPPPPPVPVGTVATNNAAVVKK